MAGRPRRRKPTLDLAARPGHIAPMHVTTSWTGLPPEARGGSVALGNFDGVHRGHAAVVAVARAARPDATLSVLTFEPHPRELFRPDDPPFHLTLPPERDRLLAGLGVAVVHQIPFDRAFSWIGADGFVEQVLHDGIGAAHVVCGPDFAFGHRRGGDVALLIERCERLGIGVTVAPHLVDEAGVISSTRIRRLLQDGYPERAASLLGRDWAIEGVVAHGDARGRTLGFPTANVPLGRHLEPQRGVYAVRVALPGGAVVEGVANIGRRPTVGGTESRVEAHLFDWAGDLYGQGVRVGLVAFLRDERKFDGLDALKTQIALDSAEARSILALTPAAREPIAMP